MMEPLTEADKIKIEKILKRQNRKLFNEAVILSITATIEKLRSGELKLTDWFIESMMKYDDWAYNFQVNKFVPLNST